MFQLGSALLDACVLAMLRKEDTYGYVLTSNIKEIFDVSESTLYPVLRRLQKEAFLTTYDVPYAGRNRRYYKITDIGVDKLRDYVLDWYLFKNNIDKFLIEDRNLYQGQQKNNSTIYSETDLENQNGGSIHGQN